LLYDRSEAGGGEGGEESMFGLRWWF
jgi:hypothetical protein